MIDVEARRFTALLLRRLASGRITNRAYDDARIYRSPDEGVVACSDAGWSIYSDMRTYRLRGADALPPATLAAVGRCVLFLHSDLVYEWPAKRVSLLGAVASLLSLGVFGPSGSAARRQWEQSGDVSVWPFMRRADYKDALGRPPYLTDRGRAA